MLCVRWYPVISLVSIAVAIDVHLEVGSVHTDLDEFYLGVGNGNHPIGSRGGGIPLQVRAALLSPRGRGYLGYRIPSLPAGHLRYCLAISGNGRSRPRVCVDSGDWMHRPTGDRIRYACGGRHDDRVGVGTRLLLRYSGCHSRRRGPPVDGWRRTPACQLMHAMFRGVPHSQGYFNFRGGTTGPCGVRVLTASLSPSYVLFGRWQGDSTSCAIKLHRDGNGSIYRLSRQGRAPYDD